MPVHFNINYEFSPAAAWERIDTRLQQIGADYVCVADGNVLQMVHNDPAYREVVDGGMFSICDSRWMPLFFKRLYGLDVTQYYGSQIFEDALKTRKYRMMFVGATREILDALKANLTERFDPRIADMQFIELPFGSVDDFDYEGIAEIVNRDNPDLIWIALGAPKQEIFMSRLKPHLRRGVMIAVGAIFKFYSGISEKRAPEWMIRCRLEFLYRMFFEPGKQWRRCRMIIRTFPKAYAEEKRKKPR